MSTAPALWRRVQRICYAALACVLIAVYAVPASANEAAVHITWTAPSRCPGETELIRAVEAYLGRPVELAGEPESAEFTAAIVVRRLSARRWVVRLRTRTETAGGERKLEGATCAEVTDAAALIVALAIDPEAVARAAGGGAADPGAPMAALTAPASGRSPLLDMLARFPGKPPETPAAATEITNATPIMYGFGLDLGLTHSTSALPGAVPGLEAAAVLRRGRLRGELGIAYAPGRRVYLEDDTARGGELSLLAGTVRGCVFAGPAGLRWCGGGELGTLAGQGVGVMAPQAQTGRWMAALAGSQLAWKLSRSFSVLAKLDLAVALRRPVFTLNIDAVERVVYRPSRFGARGFVGMEVHFR